MEIIQQKDSVVSCLALSFKIQYWHIDHYSKYRGKDLARKACFKRYPSLETYWRICEITEIGWFTAETAPKDMLESHNYLLELYKTKPVGFIEVVNL